MPGRASLDRAATARPAFRGKLRDDLQLGATEVNQAIFFSAAIIIAGFVPLFTMCGVEGHIFGPMAQDLCLCHRSAG